MDILGSSPPAVKVEPVYPEGTCDLCRQERSVCGCPPVPVSFPVLLEVPVAQSPNFLAPGTEFRHAKDYFSWVPPKLTREMISPVTTVPLFLLPSPDKGLRKQVSPQKQVVQPAYTVEVLDVFRDDDGNCYDEDGNLIPRQ